MDGKSGSTFLAKMWSRFLNNGTEMSDSARGMPRVSSEIHVEDLSEVKGVILETDDNVSDVCFGEEMDIVDGVQEEPVGVSAENAEVHSVLGSDSDHGSGDDSNECLSLLDFVDLYSDVIEHHGCCKQPLMYRVCDCGGRVKYCTKCGYEECASIGCNYGDKPYKCSCGDVWCNTKSKFTREMHNCDKSYESCVCGGIITVCEPCDYRKCDNCDLSAVIETREFSECFCFYSGCNINAKLSVKICVDCECVCGCEKAYMCMVCEMAKCYGCKSDLPIVTYHEDCSCGINLGYKINGVYKCKVCDESMPSRVLKHKCDVNSWFLTKCPLGGVVKTCTECAYSECEGHFGDWDINELSNFRGDDFECFCKENNDTSVKVIVDSECVCGGKASCLCVTCCKAYCIRCEGRHIPDVDKIKLCKCGGKTALTRNGKIFCNKCNYLAGKGKHERMCDEVIVYSQCLCGGSIEICHSCEYAECNDCGNGLQSAEDMTDHECCICGSITKPTLTICSCGSRHGFYCYCCDEDRCSCGKVVACSICDQRWCNCYLDGDCYHPKEYVDCECACGAKKTLFCPKCNIIKCTCGQKPKIYFDIYCETCKCEKALRYNGVLKCNRCRRIAQEKRCAICDMEDPDVHIRLTTCVCESYLACDACFQRRCGSCCGRCLDCTSCRCISCGKPGNLVSSRCVCGENTNICQECAICDYIGCCHEVCAGCSKKTAHVFKECCGEIALCNQCATTTDLLETIRHKTQSCKRCKLFDDGLIYDEDVHDIHLSKRACGHVVALCHSCRNACTCCMDDDCKCSLCGCCVCSSKKSINRVCLEHGTNCSVCAACVKHFAFCACIMDDICQMCQSTPSLKYRTHNGKKNLCRGCVLDSECPCKDCGCRRCGIMTSLLTDKKCPCGKGNDLCPSCECDHRESVTCFICDSNDTKIIYMKCSCGHNRGYLCDYCKDVYCEECHLVQRVGTCTICGDTSVHAKKNDCRSCNRTYMSCCIHCGNEWCSACICKCVDCIVVPNCVCCLSENVFETSSLCDCGKSLYGCKMCCRMSCSCGYNKFSHELKYNCKCKLCDEKNCLQNPECKNILCVCKECGNWCSSRYCTTCKHCIQHKCHPVGFDCVCKYCGGLNDGLKYGLSCNECGLSACSCIKCNICKKSVYSCVHNRYYNNISDFAPDIAFGATEHSRTRDCACNKCTTDLPCEESCFSGVGQCLCNKCGSFGCNGNCTCDHCKDHRCNASVGKGVKCICDCGGLLAGLLDRTILFCGDCYRGPCLCDLCNICKISKRVCSVLGQCKYVDWLRTFEIENTDEVLVRVRRGPRSGCGCLYDRVNPSCDCGFANLTYFVIENKANMRAYMLKFFDFIVHFDNIRIMTNTAVDDDENDVLIYSGNGRTTHCIFSADNLAELVIGLLKISSTFYVPVLIPQNLVAVARIVFSKNYHVYEPFIESMLVRQRVSIKKLVVDENTVTIRIASNSANVRQLSINRPITIGHFLTEEVVMACEYMDTYTETVFESDITRATRRLAVAVNRRIDLNSAWLENILNGYHLRSTNWISRTLNVAVVSRYETMLRELQHMSGFSRDYLAGSFRGINSLPIFSLPPVQNESLMLELDDVVTMTDDEDDDDYSDEEIWQSPTIDDRVGVFSHDEDEVTSYRRMGRRWNITTFDNEGKPKAFICRDKVYVLKTKEGFAVVGDSKLVWSNLSCSSGYVFRCRTKGCYCTSCYTHGINTTFSSDGVKSKSYSRKVVKYLRLSRIRIWDLRDKTVLMKMLLDILIFYIFQKYFSRDLKQLVYHAVTH